MIRTTFVSAAGLALAAGLTATAATAQTACDSISFSDVGWTDITTTTATARHVFEALGYNVDVKVLSVPVTFSALESDDIDVFLGNWMPSQNAAIQPYLDSGEIEQVVANLQGTKYNLAVPAYTYDAGLTTYEDLAVFREELDGEIYGIEPGNEANTYLVGLTETEGSPLSGFEVAESSEQGMLSQVRRAVDGEEPIVFLGWEPHPMNANFDMRFLSGGEEFFGGEGEVFTVTRKGFVEECPNAGKLLQQMKFSLAMENGIMGKILDDGMSPGDATMEWLQANEAEWSVWLDGITTVDGQPGLAAVQAALQ